jgi:hypothetical protein
LEIRLIPGDHIPDNNSELSGGGGDGGISPFSVSDPLEEWSEGMLDLISDAVGGLSECYGYDVFSFWGSTADKAATTQFIVGNESEPGGKLFCGGKSLDVISHIAKQAKNCRVADARDLEKICFQVSKG